MSDYITPVMFTDPSGELPFLAVLVPFVAANPLAALVIVAAVIVATYSAVKATEATVEYIKELKSKKYILFTCYKTQKETWCISVEQKTRNLVNRGIY